MGKEELFTRDKLNRKVVEGDIIQFDDGTYHQVVVTLGGLNTWDLGRTPNGTQYDNSQFHERKLRKVLKQEKR